MALPVNSVLVIGGGISGLVAAKRLAEKGYTVYIIEKNAYLGGKLAELDETFPLAPVSDSCSLCYPLCYLTPELGEIYGNNNIKIYTFSEVEKIEDIGGYYEVTVRKKARYVDPLKCSACGKCSEVCPVKDIPDEFNRGLSIRSAIYTPIKAYIKPEYIIDPLGCLHFTEKNCSKCAEICPEGAVNYDDTDKEETITVHSIVVATGFDQIDPSFMKRYGSEHPNVITSLQFERMCSINGPTRGKVIRPSDGKEPKKIAFIQCVGSREKDREGCVSYCSTVCCMIAAKQALNIKRKKIPDAECYIFNTERRVYGKQYNDLFIEAEHVYGVRFINGRTGLIRSVRENGNLIIQYEDADTGEVKEDEFDLVVLAAALGRSSGKMRLAALLGCSLDKNGLFTPRDISELEKRNIYITGFARFPMNIPDAVTDGAAAASKISERFPPDFGDSEYIESENGEGEICISPSVHKIAEDEEIPIRVGIVYCEFGDGVSPVLDFDRIISEVGKVPYVVAQMKTTDAYSPKGREKIAAFITDKRINRVIFTAGSKRFFAPYFYGILDEIGFERSLVEIIDLREHDAYVHSDNPEAATDKAIDMVVGAVARVVHYRPVKPAKAPVIRKAAVIGDGLTGRAAARSLAVRGIKTYVLGLDNVDLILPSDREVHSYRSAEYGSDALKHENIEYIRDAKLIGCGGYAGNYTLTLKIDGKTRELKVGTIILADWITQYPAMKGQFYYGITARVMTQREFLEKLENNGPDPAPESVVFIQCVNQKLDPTGFGNSSLEARAYEENTAVTTDCTNICCSLTFKLIRLLKKKYPAVRVHVLYRDLQLTGGKSEDIFRMEKGRALFLRYSDQDGIEVIPRGTPDNIEGFTVEFNELNSGSEIGLDADYIVLATPFMLSRSALDLARIMLLRLSADGFVMEEHSKVLPFNSTRIGIFMAGGVGWPDRPDIALSRALAAADAAYSFIARGITVGNIEVAEVDKEKCMGCGKCVKSCPYKAISFDIYMKEYPQGPRKIRKARVNPLLCKSCGICVAECPVNAIDMINWSEKALISQISAIIRREVR